MNIAILPNLDKCKVLDCLNKVISNLILLGVNVYVMDYVFSYIVENNIMDDKIKYINSYNDINNMFIDCNIAITIGGDGTIIHAAKHAAENNTPILGINMGRLGFVAGLEFDEINKIKDLVSGLYILEKRMMLDIIVNHNQDIRKFSALNDVVVSRGSFSQMIDIDIGFNDSNMTHYRADGIIVSTPTGSTAYSLSAGGPVIEPNLKCMLLTPICSHSLFSRPIIFNHTTKLSIQAYEDNNNISLTIDGDSPIEIHSGDVIEIKVSNKYVELIKMKKDSFYQILNNKLQN